MISSLLTVIIWGGVVALIVTAAVSPLETLTWWAGWSEDEIDNRDVDETPRREIGDSDGVHYIVYLSGIASLSGRFLIPRERTFIRNLRARLPGAVIVDDVFPYSPAGAPLLHSPRIFDQLWRLIQKTKLQGRRSFLSILINMRNVFQVMVSADHRYGPMFNRGAATVIEDALTRAGYVAGSGAPITVIGYSGGGQIAVGAATFLTARFDAPVDVVSIGGVIASSPGLMALRHLHQLVGARDTVQKIGAIFFPERWAALAYSEWNHARRDGRIFNHKLSNMGHAGPRGYFGLPKTNGVSNNDRTLDVVAEIIAKDHPADVAS